MNTRKVLTTENYEYQLDEQRRNRIMAEAERDRLAATFRTHPRRNYLLAVVHALNTITAPARRDLGMGVKEMMQLVCSFLLWVAHGVRPLGQMIGQGLHQVAELILHFVMKIGQRIHKPKSPGHRGKAL